MLSTIGNTGTATLERVAVEEPPPWVVGELEATTLRLVVSGVPDKAVANRLGVSHRTVQRHIRDMMDRSESKNRMQLGRRAAQAGVSATRRSAPVGEYDYADLRPDETGIQLIWLLLMDLPWDAVPRALGMSSRSVERRLHDLMTMAGAASRAQLGWHVTRYEWV